MLPSNGSPGRTPRFSLANAVSMLSQPSSKPSSRAASITKPPEDLLPASKWDEMRTKIKAMGRIAHIFNVKSDDAGKLFTPFIPKILHQQLLKYSEQIGHKLEFAGEGLSVQGAVMFSDASGFTAVRVAR